MAAKLISLPQVTVGRFTLKASYLLLLCAFSFPDSLVRTSARSRPQEIPKPVLTFKQESMFWGEGTESYFSQSMISASDGSFLKDHEYSYKSGKWFKPALKNCANNALKVLDDSILRDGKGRKVGNRKLLLIRNTNSEAVVLCRTEDKKLRLRQIYGRTIEQVLAYEGAVFPK